jgi:putative oxidoreductase
MKFLNGLQPLGLLALRVALAVIFFYHGYPKLAHGSGEMRQFFILHGFPGYFLIVSGVLEVFGSILLVIGLFVRPAALLLAIEMGLAIWKVHSGHGIFGVRDYELALALCAANFALMTVGAGAISLDHLLLGEGGTGRRRAKSSKD